MNRTRQALVVPGASLLVALSLFAAACGDDDSSGGTGPAPSTQKAGGAASPAQEQSQGGNTVVVEDNRFTPASLTVSKGTIVTWRWTGKNVHSVIGTYNGKEVKSDRMPINSGFVYTFDAPGTFEYHCDVHGASMAGKIIVQ